MIAGWTSKQYYELETLFRAQKTIEEMAEILQKTPLEIDRMMQARDLTVKASLAKSSLKKVDITDARYQPNPDRSDALFGDKMFKMAMLRAIKSGAEKAELIVRKDYTPLPVRRFYADNSGVGSPAAMCEAE
jgi:hypothetical protein